MFLWSFNYHRWFASGRCFFGASITIGGSLKVLKSQFSVVLDMLTVGMGGQTDGQYRAQFFLWAVLGAPLILGNDVRSMSNFTLSLVTSPEIIAVDQDAWCVQGRPEFVDDAVRKCYFLLLA